MNFQKALAVKQQMSQQMLNRNRAVRETVSFAAGTRAVAARATSTLPQQINGVGVARKKNGEHCLKVFTREKITATPTGLAHYYGVSPADIVVQEVGSIRFKQKERPYFPGISIGHYKITAGTIGCFVKDKKGKIYILSNNHVLANSNDAFDDDRILQPGDLDGGVARDRVAGLSWYVPLDFEGPNEMDAALAEVDDKDDLHFEMMDRFRLKGTVEHELRMKVEKFGRTTGHTVGVVTTRSLDVDIDFDNDTLSFINQMEIKARGRMFCDGGDSGSVILERKTNKVTGLLFAGADDGTTFATPIRPVLKTFSVKIV